MNGGARVRTGLLCAVAAATLAGGACAQSASPAHGVPAPAGPIGAVIVPVPANPDPVITDAPGGVTDGHRPEDLPAVTAAPQTAPPTVPGTDAAPTEPYVALD